MKLTRRLVRLERTLGPVVDRDEVWRRQESQARMRLIMSDPQAIALSNECTRIVEEACQRNPELRPCVGNHQEFLRKVDVITLERLYGPVSDLEDRIRTLR